MTGSVSCGVETGQCSCANPGIQGRTCNYCAKGTTGTITQSVLSVIMCLILL